MAANPPPPTTAWNSWPPSPRWKPHPAGAKVILHTDSNYVKDGLTKWIIGWKRNGWKTADKKPVKNQDLWIRLEAAANTHKVDWRWVKGHSGHAENDRADASHASGCDENRRASRRVRRSTQRRRATPLTRR